MRLVLMGTGPFAVPTFEAVRALGRDEIAIVVTRPVPLGDGKAKTPINPVGEWAKAAGFLIEVPVSINEATTVEMLKLLDADLFIVCDYGQILSKEAIASAKFGGINLHGSLLPRHRGAAPVQWSVLFGDKVTGASVIHLTPKLDGGPILNRVETTVGEHETAEALEKRLSLLGVEAALGSLDRIRACHSIEEITAIGDVQDPSLATKAPRLAKSDGQLDFRFPAEVIDRQIRGLQPWPGTFGQLVVTGGKEFRASINQASFVDANSDDFQPGELIWGDRIPESLRDEKAKSSSKDELLVACRPNFLKIQQVQPAGKRSMTSKEFLAGYGKSLGIRFVQPAEQGHLLLEKLVKTAKL
jgi:methionyl-tRNA formyltransferase